MKHIRTRLFGITLSFIMLISLLPVTALAGETAWDGTTVDTSWHDDNTSAAEFTISDSTISTITDCTASVSVATEGIKDVTDTITAHGGFY